MVSFQYIPKRSYRHRLFLIVRDPVLIDYTTVLAYTIHDWLLAYTIHDWLLEYTIHDWLLAYTIHDWLLAYKIHDWLQNRSKIRITIS